MRGAELHKKFNSQSAKTLVLQMVPLKESETLTPRKVSSGWMMP